MISQMTAEHIRNRLATIKNEQAAYDARDFDAELSELMRKGGDVDALESSHLDAERVARRLRVERSALEAELPAALEREASATISGLVDQHAALAAKADEVANEVVRGWAAFVSASQAWHSVQTEGEAITRRAATLSKDTSASMPVGLGLFNSTRVLGVLTEWHTRGGELMNILATAEHAIDTGIGDFTARFAKTVLATEANDNQPLAARG